MNFVHVQIEKHVFNDPLQNLQKNCIVEICMQKKINIVTLCVFFLTCAVYIREGSSHPLRKLPIHILYVYTHIYILLNTVYASVST